MRKIAPHSAKQGRLRPSFFLGSAVLLSACCMPLSAQQAIYRCGQEYTNAPKDVSRCEPLATQSVTVIPGLRPMPAEGVAPAASAPSSAAAPDAPQRQRDQQARTIVATELDRTRQRHAELVQEYRQGAPLKTAAEESSPQKYQQRVASLKAAIERHERDIDSLQRELARKAAP